MPKGIVKWYNIQKGYGFIERDGEDDLFIHHSEVPSENLFEGDVLEFEVGEGPKGPVAVEVKIVQQA